MITLQTNRQNDSALHSLIPDLTPMLDIIFILLIFFMLTAGSVLQTIDLTLPSNRTEMQTSTDTPQRIMLEINATSYALDGEKVNDFSQLQIRVPQLIQAKAQSEFAIQGDKNISIERFLNVLTFLQSQGVTTTDILMQQEHKQ